MCVCVCVMIFTAIMSAGVVRVRKEIGYFFIDIFYVIPRCGLELWQSLLRLYFIERLNCDLNDLSFQKKACRSGSL